jgi:hypothetical protein
MMADAKLTGMKIVPLAPEEDMKGPALFLGVGRRAGA